MVIEDIQINNKIKMFTIIISFEAQKQGVIQSQFVCIWYTGMYLIYFQLILDMHI